MAAVHLCRRGNRGFMASLIAKYWQTPLGGIQAGTLSAIVALLGSFGNSAFKQSRKLLIDLLCAGSVAAALGVTTAATVNDSA